MPSTPPCTPCCRSPRRRHSLWRWSGPCSPPCYHPTPRCARRPIPEPCGRRWRPAPPPAMHPPKPPCGPWPYLLLPKVRPCRHSPPPLRGCLPARPVPLSRPLPSSTLRARPWLATCTSCVPSSAPKKSGSFTTSCTRATTACTLLRNTCITAIGAGHIPMPWLWGTTWGLGPWSSATTQAALPQAQLSPHAQPTGRAPQAAHQGDLWLAGTAYAALGPAQSAEASKFLTAPVWQQSGPQTAFWAAYQRVLQAHCGGLSPLLLAASAPTHSGAAPVIGTPYVP